MKSTFYLIVALFLFSCEDSEMLTQNDVPSIRYGTSFGECAGYCLTDLEVSAEQVYYVSYGWHNSQTPKTNTVTFTSEQYNHLLGLFDQDKFLALDPVIGCPDCADGGSEWIEMTIGSRTKKVTFEYHKDIDPIAPLIDELRSLTEEVEVD